MASSTTTTSSFGCVYIEQVYTNCLAHAAYYIECDGEAAVVDPLRDPTPYLQLCKSRNAKLKYVFETHLHADFVGGQLDLHKATGATIVFGPTASPSYPFHLATDGETLHLGSCSIQVLHTPGHTMESSCYLLKVKERKGEGEEEVPKVVFTGDTLFVGSAGRPDLASKSGELTVHDLATHLYHSLHTKLATLPDSVLLYPGHGAGSPCGANLSKETYSTIGKEKLTNFALNPNLGLEEFVVLLTKDLTKPPAYFFHDVGLNKSGPMDFEFIQKKATQGISLQQFKEELNKSDVVVLDTRPAVEFLSSHIPGSLNVGLSGQFVIWVGTVIPPSSPLLILSRPEEASQSVTRLARIGFDNILGFLEGGLDSWKSNGEKTETIEDIEPKELAKKKEKYSDSLVILDVRGLAERENNGYFLESLAIPLGELQDRLSDLGEDKSSKQIFVHCASGFRSSIASSLLKKNGFLHVSNVRGGWNLISKEAEELKLAFKQGKVGGCATGTATTTGSCSMSSCTAKK